MLLSLNGMSHAPLRVARPNVVIHLLVVFSHPEEGPIQILLEDTDTFS